MKIAFLWFGFDNRYGVWRDGLWAAMKEIEKEHEVRYYDVTHQSLEQIEQFQPDWVLFWEAPCTARGPNADMWYSVCRLPFKKALLFAGGPLNAMDVEPFDMVFVESEIDAETCERLGIPHCKAFGVNTKIMHPMVNERKTHLAFMQATFAGWKRHELFAEAMRSEGCVAGRTQQFDTNGYDRCVKLGVEILPELEPGQVAKELNASFVVLNTSNAEGGGQRCTLEAMACGIPVVVMSDSPKNCEFVRESGAGTIVDPDPALIREAVLSAKQHFTLGDKGWRYVEDKYTEKHYADAILGGLNSI